MVSPQQGELVEKIGELSRANARLREVLGRLDAATVALADRVTRGEALAEALPALGGRLELREVRHALDEWEGLRRQVRVLLLAQGHEEGTSMAEMGRMLGFSRQLASRLGADAQRLHEEDTGR